MNTMLPLTAALLGAALLPNSPSTEELTVDRVKNERPVCRIMPVPTVTCQGDIAVVQLDGSASFDVDGDTLTYLWQACPGSTLDNPTSATPILTIDTSAGCDRTCGVRFQVSDGEFFSECRIFINVEGPTPPTSPHLDIKPGSCPNPINVSNYASIQGSRVAVSLLGNDFDVTQANVSTIRLRKVIGGGDMMPLGDPIEICPIQADISDTGTPFLGGGVCGCHADEGVGIIDLDMKFLKAEWIDMFDLTQEANNTLIEFELVGETYDGTPFSARDCIRVINNG